MIPVPLNRPENTDLQFMPEGGYLVAGIPSRIGFKAIVEDGRGTALEGKILNSRLQEVAGFKSVHKGRTEGSIPAFIWDCSVQTTP